MSVKRTAARPMTIMLTDEEHEAMHATAKDRGLSLRDLVVGCVVGSQPSDVVSRLCMLEARVSLLVRSK